MSAAKAPQPKTLVVFAATAQMFYNWCHEYRITPTDPRVRFMRNPAEQFRGYHPTNAQLVFLMPEHDLPQSVQEQIKIFRSTK